jgi:hypothetical protein
VPSVDGTVVTESEPTQEELVTLMAGGRIKIELRWLLARVGLRDSADEPSHHVLLDNLGVEPYALLDRLGEIWRHPLNSSRARSICLF